MKYLITGATGFIGRKLIEELMLNGHNDIHILTRNSNSSKKQIPFPVKHFEWDIDAQKIDLKAFQDRDIVIHLAGASIAGSRWTDSYKEKMLESRIKPLNLLIKCIQEHNISVQKFISASAIGIYGDRGEENCTESSKSGDDFLATVCKNWEETLHQAELRAIKTHSVRIGLVLGKDGGALPLMLPAFKAGIAGKLGSGNQYMSWIHINDLVKIFRFVSEENIQNKIINAVSPNPKTNKEFTKTLGKILGRPTIFAAPAPALKLILGEMSDLLLKGQKVIPNILKDNNFNFTFPNLDAAFIDILKYDLKGETNLIQYQYLPHPPQDIFDFFQDEKNLEKLTPNFLGFKVLGKSTDQIKTGTFIDYKLSVHGIPLKWKTEILEFTVNERFIDNQVKGPYNKWFHIHEFIPLGNGTLMIDNVTYKEPFGCLGKIVSGPFVKKDVKTIFNYRRKVIDKIYSAN